MHAEKTLTGAALTKSETLTFGPGGQKTYFDQKKGLHPLNIDINNTENNRPDLPVSTVVLPSPYLPSQRGLWPKYILQKNLKNLKFSGKSLVNAAPV